MYLIKSRATLEKETIVETLKSIEGWISMLKRLMGRVLNTNVSLDVPLQIYLERTGLWGDRVSDADLARYLCHPKRLRKETTN